MLKKYLFTIAIFAIFLQTFVITYAQENKTEKIASEITQNEDMQKNMESIASDGTLRVQMINLMIQNCEGDKNALMEIGRTMINNPEMHVMIKEMMNKKESIKVQSRTDEKSKDHKGSCGSSGSRFLK